MIKRLALLLTLLIYAGLGFASATSTRVPTVDDLLTIKSVGGAQISPDGKWVAYTVGYGDFKQDAFITQIWLAETGAGKTFQLTRGDRASTNPRWSPDGQWLAFLSNRQDDRNQIFLINPAGGEAQQLTKSETAISNFAWSEVLNRFGRRLSSSGFLRCRTIRTGRPSSIFRTQWPSALAFLHH